MNEDPKHIFSIAELNFTARTLLESEIGQVWVTGEISNLSQPASGHMYFSLKDKDAQVSCAFFRMSQRGLKFNVEDGQHILARAKVSIYEGRGNYQLIINQLDLAGSGALQLAFEKLKTKLSKAGLFDSEHKQDIPKHPQNIGIITSATGAALQDILRVLKRRSPQTPIIIYPSLVQGDQAKQHIVKAITIANARNECDVLLLARGGGSIEDLWPFNEECVANAIFNSKIPIISGVGHETDFTIADFVADLRAATPSAAAELASTDKKDLEHKIQQVAILLKRSINQHITTKIQHLKLLRQRLRHPKDRLQAQAQQLDHIENTLKHHMQMQLKKADNQLQQLTACLPSPLNKLKQQKQYIQQQDEKIILIIHQILQQEKHKLHNTQQRLNALNPLSTLERGYAIIKSSQGKIASSVKKLTTTDAISIQLHDGELQAKII